MPGRFYVNLPPQFNDADSMQTFSPSALQRVCTLTNAVRCTPREVVQSLWSGYGRIQKVDLDFDEPDRTQSAIVKFVEAGRAGESHPRGWNGDASHSRKIRSYEVERNFYATFSSRCGDQCRVAKFLGAESHSPASESDWLMVLEDLDQPSNGCEGFPVRKNSVAKQELLACLSWLASFHAAFMGIDARAVESELWPVGTYWHLATRQDELDAMESGDLKKAAAEIDQRLNSCRIQTLVHGDAKLANFCFPASPGVAAAVDFQYVGRGCGMKDVAYLISSCLSDTECLRQQDTLLNAYFEMLQAAVTARPDLEIDFCALESQWRELYRFAWADFYRFLAGWSPGHWKMHGYSDEITAGVLRELG